MRVAQAGTGWRPIHRFLLAVVLFEIGTRTVRQWLFCTSVGLYYCSVKAESGRSIRHRLRVWQLFTVSGRPHFVTNSLYWTVPWSVAVVPIVSRELVSSTSQWIFELRKGTSLDFLPISNDIGFIVGFDFNPEIEPDRIICRRSRNILPRAECKLPGHLRVNTLKGT